MIIGSLAGLLIIFSGGMAEAGDAHHQPAYNDGIYWGATIGQQFTGKPVPYSMVAARDFQRNERKAPSILHFYYPLATCGRSCHGLPFPAGGAQAIRNAGAIPLITWMGDAGNSPAHDPRFSLRTIVDGRWDGAITRFAIGAKRWGHPFFLRFDPEMNGNWLPWGNGVNHNTPSEFVAAWRHVYDIFQSVGATNATWVWCPYINWTRGVRREYPGNRYVGWTCMDGYNWGTNPSSANTVHEWQSFKQLFTSTYRTLKQVAPDKPIMIAEFATSAWGGSKPAWIRNALTEIPRSYPGIRAVVYFDWSSPDGMDWPLESDPQGEAAFADGIRSGIYLPNVFGALRGPQIYPAP
ncbi:glycoside hydrolase family 26 protein [Conexibacter sp. DBS9H8]|uniref:glycoside hydrolase family 26 protein n=1 Tax=Conexibacter sp. DBS9H8 TaxID=2937801 RepID=UPI00200D89EA|nr:glycosyl hydrolase [Conexibacter sp. DBS9H8]